MTQQIDLSFDVTAAEARRDDGMRRVEERAKREIAEWDVKADESLQTFLRVTEGAFLAEQWVAWALKNGLPAPPDSRAFGPVVMRNARRGFIYKVGYAPANTSNRSPKCLWRRKRIA